MVNSGRFWMGPISALSIDRDLEPAENINVLRSTLVRLYATRTQLNSPTMRQDGGVRMYASNQQVGVQKFESGFGNRCLVHQV